MGLGDPIFDSRGGWGYFFKFGVFGVFILVLSLRILVQGAFFIESERLCALFVWWVFSNCAQYIILSTFTNYLADNQVGWDENHTLGKKNEKYLILYARFAGKMTFRELDHL